MRSETRSFPAVLLALASLGVPLKAAPTNGVLAEAQSAVDVPDYGDEAAGGDDDAGGLGLLLARSPELDVTGAPETWGFAVAGPESGVETSLEAAKDETVTQQVDLGDDVPGGEVLGAGLPTPLMDAEWGGDESMELTSGAGEPRQSDDAAYFAAGRTTTDMAPTGTVVDESTMYGVDRANPVEGGPVSDGTLPIAAGGTSLAADTVTLDPRMLRNLSRDFVARLNRVAERMWNEHGMRLEVVEGYRTPRRQQELFAQGRSTPGPVVTWTQNSLHSAGAAADVFVDGAPVATAVAPVLARVAREEGLSTLHPFDSGHVQMEGLQRSAGPEGPLQRERPSTPGVSAQPRGVAPVAPTAPVARPARPGGEGEGAASPTGPQVTESATRSSPPPIEAAMAASDAVVSSERSTSKVTRAHAEEGGAAATSDVAGQSALASMGSERGARISDSGRVEVGAASPVAPAPAPEPAAPAAWRRVHVPIDGVGGASLQLGIRPGSVDARLNISDPVLAQSLDRNLPELRQALASRGLESPGLAVRMTPVSTADGVADVVTRLQSASGGDATGGDASTFAHRERAQRFRERPDQEDHPRRPRHDHTEERTS